MYTTDDILIWVALVIAIIYVILVRVCIAYWMAKKRHRAPLGWVLLSMFFSPLLTWIILLIVGDNIDTGELQERLDRLERAEEEKRYNESHYEDVTH